MDEPNQMAIIVNVKKGVTSDEVYSLLEEILPDLATVLKVNKFAFPEDAKHDEDLVWIDDRYADWVDEEDDLGEDDFG